MHYKEKILIYKGSQVRDDKLSPLVKKALRSGDLGLLGAGELNKQLIEERKRLQETRKELLAKKRAAEAAGRSVKTLTKELNRNNAALTQTRNALIAVKTNLGGIGRGGLILVGTFNKIGKAARFLGKSLRFAARSFNIVGLAIAGLVAAASTLAEFTGLVNEFNQILIFRSNCQGSFWDRNRRSSKSYKRYCK